MLGVHIAAVGGGWNSREGALLARSDAQLAAEGGERNRQAREEFGRSFAKAGNAQRRFREVIGQQPEAGNAGGPAPIRRAEVEQLDLEAVARLCALDADGPIHLIHA